MLTFSLALRNVLRNRERSLLTLIGVLLAIGSFVALVSLAEGLSRRIEMELDSRAVDIYVMPEQALALPSGPIGTIGYSQDTISNETLTKIKELPNVAEAIGVNRDSWKGRHAILPILYLDQRAIAVFFPNLSGVPEDLAEGQVILGQGLARQEFGSGGADAIQHGQTRLRVVGIVRGGGFQDFFAFVKPAEQNNGYQEIWLKLSDINLASGDAATLRSQFPGLKVLTRREYLASSNVFVRYAWLLQASIASIGVLIAITASMNTMLMSTYERLREFAVLRAIGASRATVGMMLLWESLMLSGMGGILGCLFGVLVSGVLDEAVVVLLQLPFPLAQITPLLLLQGMLLSMLVGGAGALIPLILIWRQQIMDGLRTE
ncbi:MAG: ABC transporter permease [Candidatus Eremiobacteraeota bacterium]|nr:ABC transporter permease [Candidatus Eremiobacteraeota bacterium]MCW5866908.1 ABC transporter permease [Candidatus Eremiobacteraeota bacterium]